MDARYRARWPELKAEIARRTARGERLKDICAPEGMPSAAAVLGWRRRDPLFDREMADAMALGRTRRDAFDPAVAKALLDRLSAGEALAAVVRDPAMPSWRRLRLWRATAPGFAEALGLQAEGKAGIRIQRLRERRRAFDQAAADRIIVGLNRGEGLRALLNGDPSLPSAATVARWRRENREFDALVRLILAAWARKRARARLFSEALQEAVLARIVEGHSFNSLSRLPGMPCRKTLGTWVRTRPDFAREVAQACEDREDIFADQALEIALAGGPDAGRRVGRLRRQAVRLRNRPGRRRKA